MRKLDSASNSDRPATSRRWLVGFLLAVTLVLLCSGVLQAQGPGEGCKLQKGFYLCDWQQFRTRFAAIHTVSIEVKPMERATEARMRELVDSLGKRIAPPEQHGEVIFRVVPASSTGIAIGPADQPLATLQVLTPGTSDNPEKLLWAETFVGQADRPWPMVVTAVANQFRARFDTPHR